MITKIYDLWQSAFQDEKDKEMYSKKSKKDRTADTTEEVRINDLDGGSSGGFGAPSSTAAAAATKK